MTRVAVIGAGTWGTAVGAIAAVNAEAVLWARDPSVAARVDAEHVNPDYLSDIPLPETLHATADLAEACTGADVVVMGVPSHGFRDVHLRPPAARTHPKPPAAPGAAATPALPARSRPPGGTAPPTSPRCLPN